MNVVSGWRHDAMIAFLLGSQHVTTSHSETEEGQKWDYTMMGMETFLREKFKIS